MAFKDTAVNLILQAKNLLSGEADAAADSVENLADSAEGLKDKLRALQDNGRLVKQFQDAEKAVQKTSTAWDRAGLKVDKLKERIEKSGEATDTQAKELKLAEKALDNASLAYEKAESSLKEYGQEMEDVGLATEDARKTQTQLTKESIKTKRALEDVGKGADTAEKSLEELNQETEKGNSRLSKFGKSLASSAGSLVKWGAAAAAATAAASLVVLTRLTAGQADLARQALTTSQALNISTDALQSWQYAAETVGIEGDKVSDIFKDLSEKLGDAFLAGGGEAKEVVEGLGLSLNELIKLSPDKALLKISDALDKVGDQGNKVFVLESLASDASLLLPLLEKNAAGLKKLQEQAAQRGVLVSEDDLKKLKATDDAFRQIGDRLTQFKNKLAAELAPTFTKIAGDFETFLGNNPQLIEKITTSISSLLESTREWITYTLENSGKITRSLRETGNTVDGLRLLFVSALRGVQAFGAGSLEVASRVVYSWKSAGVAILEFRNTLGLATDESVAAAKFSLEAVGQSVLDLKGQSEDYQAAMIEAGNAAGFAFAAARDAAAEVVTGMVAVVAGANDVVSAQDEIAGSADGVAEATLYLKQTQQQLGEQIASTVQAIEAAQAAWSEDPTEQNQQALASLREEYARLQEALADYAGATSVIKDSSLVQQFKDTAAGLDETTAAADRAKDKVSEVASESEGAAEGVEKVGRRAATSASVTATAVAGIASGWFSRIAALSDAATALFKRNLGLREAAVEAGTLQEKLDGIGDRINAIGFGFTNSGIVSSLNKMARAGLETEASFVSQQIQVQKLTEKILSGNASMNQLKWTTEDVEQRFSLLDGSQLGGLIGAIGSAQREMDALQDSLQDTLRSARQELAGLQGDTRQVELLRFQEKEQELRAQLEYAKRLGDAESVKFAQDSLDISVKSHKIRLEQIREAGAAEQQRAADRASEESRRRQLEEQEERQDISRVETRTQAQTTQVSSSNIVGSTVTLNIQANGAGLGALSDLDSREVEALIRAIENSSFLTT